MPTDLVLLDLDETLLPTKVLAGARHAKEPVNLSGVEGYGSIRLHDGIVEVLDQLRRSVQVGLVSSSGRWYVEQLLDAFLPGFEFVVTVTYDDVAAIKPDPEPLLLALERAAIPAGQALYVGDADVDFAACEAAGLAFVGAGWADRPTFPSAAPWVRTPQDLFELVGVRA